jgi:acetyl-CoA carboxylase biotin carboxyl carrier protein
MDIRKIKKLVDLLNQSGIAELEVREGEELVRIARHGPASLSARAGGALQAHTVSDASLSSHEPGRVEAGHRLPHGVSGHTVISPMVGTFYEAAAPGAKPFVELGQSVKVGDPLCIIEAMKILNQIEADETGRITAILVANGQPVEYGEPLFIVDPVVQ